MLHFCYRDRLFGGDMATDINQAAVARRFCTNDLPEPLRSAAIRDYLADLMRVDVSALDPEKPLHYSASMHTVDGASWGSAYLSPLISDRTSHLVKDGQDDLILGMSETGMLLQIPGKEDFIVGPGESFVLSFAREMRLVNQGGGRLQGIRVPHRPIAGAVPRLGSAPVMVIPSATPMLSLLFQYADLLERNPLAGSTAQQVAARHLQELVAVVAGASGDFREQAEKTTVSAARLLAVRAEISKQLSNSNFDIKWIAAQQHVTPRHLQRLFKREGTSFSDELRRARLARARSMLEDPCHANRTISEIALECGYPEASSMNRHFRQEFGLTPSDVRWRK